MTTKTTIAAALAIAIAFTAPASAAFTKSDAYFRCLTRHAAIVITKTPLNDNDASGEKLAGRADRAAHKACRELRRGINQKELRRLDAAFDAKFPEFIMDMLAPHSGVEAAQ